MKKSLVSMIFFFLVLAAGAQEKNLLISPAKPQPGATVTIRYNPANTSLDGVKNFEAIAYLLDGKLPLALEIPLKEENGHYVGSFKTTDTAKAFFISFFKDELRDNNGETGYYSALYNKAGKEVLGANMALGSAFGSYGSIWELSRNADLAKEFNKKEFAAPVARTEFYNEYFSYLGQSKEDVDKELLKAELQKHLARKDLSEADVMRVKSIYENTFKDKEKGEAVFASIKQKFPNGNWKRAEQITAFNKEPDLPKKAQLFAEILAAYPPSTKDDQGVIDNMARTMAIKYADSSNWDRADYYASLINTATTGASVYNSLAWKLAGGGLTKTPVDVAAGIKLSQKSIALLEEEMKNPRSMPGYMTGKQWAKNLSYSHQSYLNTYATLLYHNKEVEKAFAIQKKIVEHHERKNVNMNEAYTFLLERLKGPAAAQEELEKFIADGKNTTAMKDQLKAIYLQKHSEDEWTAHLDKLETIAFNKLKEELAKKMINMPAPLFSLKDLSGKQVSLASLKGKTVVVDFWATWCGPCIASFPGMQKAVDKYKNNPDVVFLFIDTWEGGDDREKKVTSFIEKNKYTFNVLYDDSKKENENEFVVVSDFKVDGIPTKFVVDKNSNIRFKSVGWMGSVDGLVTELSAMIELASSGSESSSSNEKKVLK